MDSHLTSLIASAKGHLHKLIWNSNKDINWVYHRRVLAKHCNFIKRNKMIHGKNPWSHEAQLLIISIYFDAPSEVYKEIGIWGLAQIKMADIQYNYTIKLSHYENQKHTKTRQDSVLRKG